MAPAVRTALLVFNVAVYPLVVSAAVTSLVQLQQQAADRVALAGATPAQAQAAAGGALQASASLLGLCAAQVAAVALQTAVTLWLLWPPSALADAALGFAVLGTLAFPGFVLWLARGCSPATAGAVLWQPDRDWWMSALFAVSTLSGLAHLIFIFMLFGGCRRCWERAA
jgi:hypothetical protein